MASRVSYLLLFFFYQLDFNIADNSDFGCFSRGLKHSMCPDVHDVSHACSEKNEHLFELVVVFGLVSVCPRCEWLGSVKHSNETQNIFYCATF